MFTQMQISNEHEIDYSRNRLTLAFNDQVIEKRFQAAYFKTNFQITRACHLIAIFFYCLVGVWDSILIDPSRANTWFWVASFVAVMFLAGFVSSFLIPEIYARFWQQLFSFYVLMTGAGFTVVTIASRPNYPVHNYVGIIFCLFFCYTFIRLTFVWAALAGNFIIALYIIGSLYVQAPANLLLNSFFYMFGINLLGMMVCYALELMSRRDFMLHELLKQTENKTRELNAQLEQRVKERTRELRVKIKREKELVARLEEDEKKLHQSLTSLEQAEIIARLGYFERNWQTGEGYWSKGFYKLLGYEDPVGMMTHDEFTAFIFEEDRKRVTEHIQESLIKHKPMDIEFRIAQKDGNIIQIHGIADNFYSKDDKPLMTRGIFQDITEHKQAADTLKKMEGQLIQAQKMESVGRLAGGVAHDYNNISSIIIGYAELALDNISSEDPLYVDIEEILTAAKRATEITRQLLAFARKQTIDPRIVDLNENLETMLKMLRRLIGEDIDLAWLPSKEIWPLKIDPTQIDQILANLCANARDAISGVGKVTIETQNISFDEDYCAEHAGFIPGDFLMLAVSDDGKGMSKDTIDKIFEPFYTTKSIGKGTGLGMATVYGIVKQNNGFINVYSEPEKGTTIKIYLPRHEGATVESITETHVKISSGKGETILLVEDAPSNLKLYNKILESLKYNVLTANTPGNAIELAMKQSGKIDLLITDVIMPDMNGRELSERLREICPGLKTLYMSGYTANVIAHRGVLEKGVRFIPKPFSRKDVAIKIRTIFDNSV